MTPVTTTTTTNPKDMTPVTTTTTTNPNDMTPVTTTTTTNPKDMTPVTTTTTTSTTSTTPTATTTTTPTATTATTPTATTNTTTDTPTDVAHTTDTSDTPSTTPVPSSQEEIECPENSEIVSNRSLCYCSVGFTGPVGGPCESCSDCISIVVFTTTLYMNMSEFTLSASGNYRKGVAEALGVNLNAVEIQSPTERIIHDRRLLGLMLLVETAVSVPTDRVSSVAGAVTQANFETSAFFTQFEISSVSTTNIVSVPSVTRASLTVLETTPRASPTVLETTPGPISIYMLAVIAGSGVIVLMCICIICTVVCVTSHAPDYGGETSGNVGINPSRSNTVNPYQRSQFTPIQQFPKRRGRDTERQQQPAMVFGPSNYGFPPEPNSRDGRTLASKRLIMCKIDSISAE
ncbi:hypothetical protein T484DRAFT_1756919 [Baffinella frigidus]|nr:hypothetical protein T484DRAFT_1756919 [Cryptophyta sp. CCMP2293]